jgi:hypothetical protein
MKMKQSLQIRQENIKPYAKSSMQITDSLHRKIPKNPLTIKILAQVKSLTSQEISQRKFST